MEDSASRFAVLNGRKKCGSNQQKRENPGHRAAGLHKRQLCEVATPSDAVRRCDLRRRRPIVRGAVPGGPPCGICRCSTWPAGRWQMPGCGSEQILGWATGGPPGASHPAGQLRSRPGHEARHGRDCPGQQCAHLRAVAAGQPAEQIRGRERPLVEPVFRVVPRPPRPPPPRVTPNRGLSSNRTVSGVSGPARVEFLPSTGPMKAVLVT
jgi:hypothetical protein